MAFNLGSALISHTVFCLKRTPVAAKLFIPQKLYIKSFCKSQFPLKSVNLFSILVMIKDKLMDFCGKLLLQNDLKITLCEISPALCVCAPLSCCRGLQARFCPALSGDNTPCRMTGVTAQARLLHEVLSPSLGVQPPALCVCAFLSACCRASPHAGSWTRAGLISDDAFQDIE